MHKDRTLLTDAQWIHLAPLLPGQAHTRGVTAANTRLLIAAVLWRRRILARDLPERFTPWQTVFARFS